MLPPRIERICWAIRLYAGGLKSISSIKPYHMLVQWEEGELEEDFVFGMVTNTRSVGGFKNSGKPDCCLK